MFYDPRQDLRPAPLTHNPLNALVAPRPIGWIGTLSAVGDENLAPFSYFNAFSADPPVVAFAPSAKPSDGSAKDSLANVREVPEFTASIVSAALAQRMNLSSRTLDRNVSEFEEAGLCAAASTNVRPPHVAQAKAVLECTVFDIVALPRRPGGRASFLVIGEVVGIHIDDDVIVAGKIDSLALAQVARLGYFDFSVVKELFEMRRPD